MDILARWDRNAGEKDICMYGGGNILPGLCLTSNTNLGQNVFRQIFKEHANLQKILGRILISFENFTLKILKIDVFKYLECCLTFGPNKLHSK